MHPLTPKDGVVIKLPTEKANGFLQLALDLVTIILKSFSRIITVIMFGYEDFYTPMNPKRVKDAELMACIVDKHVLGLGLTSVSIVESFIFGASRCRVIAGSLALEATLQPVYIAILMVATIAVVGDISEFVTEDLIFLAERVLPGLILPGNLENAIT